LLPGTIWFVILGTRVLRPGIAVRRALLATHAALAPLSVLLVVYGVHCLRAARRSAEAGGGLLGAVGLLPIVMGALAGGLAVVSLCAAFSPRMQGFSEAEQHVRQVSPEVARCTSPDEPSA
jgi:hypothetical protein